ncbi:hypothetical protein G4B88_023213 [Cannabis sativa]|uniref:Ubiquitin-like protease family profile domain-containing protein n=1 Tax=Cannabis sativa TaxID=3483 RepID=A0A7J6DYI9_CANSA|nr:hypothetical protein G4B88_023213 [Cannabis sativa]
MRFNLSLSSRAHGSSSTSLSTRHKMVRLRWMSYIHIVEGIHTKIEKVSHEDEDDVEDDDEDEGENEEGENEESDNEENEEGYSQLPVEDDDVVMAGLKAIAKFYQSYALVPYDPQLVSSTNLDLTSVVNIEESDPNVAVENFIDIDEVTPPVERRILKPGLHLQSPYAKQLSSSSKPTIVTSKEGYEWSFLYFVPANNKLEPAEDVVSLKKKAKYSTATNMKITTTYCYFNSSIRTPKYEAASLLSLEPYSVFMMSFLTLPAFVNPTTHFTIVNAEALPEQVDNDCGAFVADFAEYFIEGKNISANFDVEEYRLIKAFCVENVESEPESPPKSPKKTTAKARGKAEEKDMIEYVDNLLHNLKQILNYKAMLKN